MQASLTRAFRRVVGMPPATWRRAQRRRALPNLGVALAKLEDWLPMRERRSRAMLCAGSQLLPLSGVAMLISHRPIAAVLAALVTSGLFVLVDCLFSYAG